MKRKDELLALPVLNKNNGKRIGSIKNFTFDPENKKIIEFIVQKKNIFNNIMIIPFKTVSCIGKFSIMINLPKYYTGIKVSSRKDQLDSNIIEFTEFKAYSLQGKEVGKISNFLMNETTGIIEGFEIAKSLIDDIKYGRLIITDMEHLHYNNGTFIFESDNY